jgi:acetylornithine deacetylase/succinyl-diaminopimelate desuccinylase-like protein
VEHEKEILQEFCELLAIPDVASDTPNIQRNARKIRGMLARRGLTTQVLAIGDAPPIVVGDLVVSPSPSPPTPLPEGEGSKVGRNVVASPSPSPATRPSEGEGSMAGRTIAFYAHYDGQPVDVAKWKSDPWKPVMRDRDGRDVDWRRATSIDPEWRLYARAAGDDKAPIIGMLAALDAMRAANVNPKVNLRFVFEGEEEAGSPHLAQYLDEYPKVLRPDGWVFCDGPVHQSRRMQLFFGVRGAVALDLTVYGPVKGLHDGHYGNWVPNPIIRLTHLLDSMRDEQGHILIRGFYDDVTPATEAERKALRVVPDVEPELRREFQIASTEGDGKSLNELLLLPALNVRGIESGRVGGRASNTINTEAHASIDFRLVPKETPESIKLLVERHIEGQGYKIVRATPDSEMRLKYPKLIKVTWGPSYPAARTPMDLALSREVVAIMTAGGHEPVRMPSLGGSLPTFLLQRGSTPVIGLPIANHDDNQHAENENLRLQNLWDGIEIYAALFAGLQSR